MNVLSLFDGMSCGRIALERAGLPVTNYFASEIDKDAILISKDNYPDIIQIGDVTKVNGFHVDLLIAGSPCQGFSRSGNGLNFDHHGSKLYFDFLRILKEVRIKNRNVYFLLENVKMAKWCEDVITSDLNVTPIKINSSLVSAQNRERIYWTNIPVNSLPEDKNLYLIDIIDEKADRKYMSSDWVINQRFTKNYMQYDPNNTGNSGQAHRAYYLKSKMGCLHTKSGTDSKVIINGKVGRLTRNEAEKLQTVPLDYTRSVSEIKAINVMGNGWTVDIISHLLQGLRP